MCMKTWHLVDFPFSYNIPFLDQYWCSRFQHKCPYLWTPSRLYRRISLVVIGELFRGEGRRAIESNREPPSFIKLPSSKTSTFTFALQFIETGLFLNLVLVNSRYLHACIPLPNNLLIVRTPTPFTPFALSTPSTSHLALTFNSL
jgi:hypothetical protein